MPDTDVRCDGCDNSRTDLVSHHGVTDIFDQVADCTYITYAVWELRDHHPVLR